MAERKAKTGGKSTKKVGRPAIPYDPKYYDTLARQAAMLGLKNEQIASALGIGPTTLKKWMREYATFATAVKEGRDRADAKVAKGLYLRAVGFRYRERKMIFGNDPGTPQRVEVTTKRVPPDPVACIFWLKNRQPQLWRDKHDHAITGGDGGPVKVENVARQEILADPRLNQAADDFERELARLTGRGGKPVDKEEVDMGGSSAPAESEDH